MAIQKSPVIKHLSVLEAASNRKFISYVNLILFLV